MYFEIKKKRRYVEIAGASKKKGAVAQLYDYRKAAHQQWIVGDSRYMLFKNRNSGMCLNVAGGSKKAGARIIQWPCSTKHRNSQWYWGSKDDPEVLVNRNSRLCMAVGGSSPKNGAWLVQMPCRIGWESQHPYFVFS